ncbi:MAG: hypothetical protein ACQERB_05870 [Promethearchaeati archaeon]
MLNWTSEVITNGLVAIVIFIAVFICSSVTRKRKIRSVLYIRLVIFILGIYSLLEALADLLLLKILAVVAFVLLFPLAIFAVMAVNYILKDTYFSFVLFILFATGPVLILLSIQSDSIILVTEDIYIYYTTINWALISELFFIGVFGIYFFYWGLKTYLNAPFLIKREALIFFIGVLMGSVITVSLNALVVFLRYILIVALIIGIFGIIVVLVSVEKEPKLLYILPFIVYRISVKDQEGFPLYDHDWSDSSINEILFTGFINAVQHMSKEVMDIGGLLDINMEKGIMVLNHSKFITVGLVASKSSKLLRDSLTKFTREFEIKFESELKNSIRDMNAYKGAYELIDKYFSNFPYRIFKSRKQKLLLSGKFTQIPKELDERIKTVFPNEKEYEFIKSELLKVPLYTYSEFEALYNELKEEMKQISKDESKYLDSNIEN